jgi:hypothetical protein
MKHSFLLIIILLVLFSCKNDPAIKINDTVTTDNPIPDTTTDYFPIKVGMTREYSFHLVSKDKELNGTAVMRVEGTERLNEKPYFKIVYVHSGMPGAESQVYYYRKANEGYYMIEGNNRSFPEYLDIKLPLKAGDKWRADTPLGQVEYHVEKIEDVILLDKTYKDCIKLSMKSESISSDSYLAPGVGIVKQVVHVKSIDGVIEYDLIK